MVKMILLRLQTLALLFYLWYNIASYPH